MPTHSKAHLSSHDQPCCPQVAVGPIGRRSARGAPGPGLADSPGACPIPGGSTDLPCGRAPNRRGGSRAPSAPRERAVRTAWRAPWPCALSRIARVWRARWRVTPHPSARPVPAAAPRQYPVAIRERKRRRAADLPEPRPARPAARVALPAQRPGSAAARAAGQRRRMSRPAQPGARRGTSSRTARRPMPARFRPSRGSCSRGRRGWSGLSALAPKPVRSPRGRRQAPDGKTCAS